MTYDQLRAEEGSMPNDFLKRVHQENARRQNEATLRRIQDHYSHQECPSDHHWIQTPSTPKTCPTCGKPL